jgi:predicted RNA-binding protein
MVVAEPRQPRYWLIVASKDHVVRGVSEGICQVNHGKRGPLSRIKKGDWVVFYSPRERFGGEPGFQRFTAVGRVKDDEVYKVHMMTDFDPYRRKVDFRSSSEASILPLIDSLSFIKDKRRWGFPFRFGLFEVPQTDFFVIASAMHCRLERPEEGATR